MSACDRHLKGRSWHDPPIDRLAFPLRGEHRSFPRRRLPSPRAPRRSRAGSPVRTVVAPCGRRPSHGPRPLPVHVGQARVRNERNLTMNPSRTRKGGALALIAALALITSACSGGGAPKSNDDTSSGGGGGNSGYTFAMITHETPGDTFWDRIKAGAQQAAKDTGSTLKYSADPDATKQAVLIQNAIDSKVDGIATTLVTPDALIPNVKKAVAAGIPANTFNSGLGFYKQAGAITHFSSDEFLAGQQAGQKAKAGGAKKVLCVIQQTGSVALEDRCKGVKDSFPNTVNIQVNGADDSAVTSVLQAKLTQDKSINWVITIGAAPAPHPPKVHPAAGSAAAGGTFDLNIDAAQAVKDGTLQFAIDQQPYLQGYLAITQLYLFKLNGNIMGGGGPVLTGPSFVDKTNVDAVLPFIQKNTR